MATITLVPNNPILRFDRDGKISAWQQRWNTSGLFLTSDLLQCVIDTTRLSDGAGGFLPSPREAYFLARKSGVSADVYQVLNFNQELIFGTRNNANQLISLYDNASVNYVGFKFRVLDDILDFRMTAAVDSGVSDSLRIAFTWD